MPSVLDLPIDLATVEAAIRFQQRNQLLQLYPETGPLRRELYAKHMEVMAAGKDCHCRYVLGANRCLTLDSVLETDRGERQCRELIGDSGVYVRSWDGSSRCTKKASPLFLRGWDRAFLVGLGNGQAFQCSGRHQVLRSAESGERHPSDWVSIAQLVHDADALHWKRTHRDLTASYGTASCLDDGRWTRVRGFSLERLQRQLDVPNNDRSGSLADEAASRSEYIHACPSFSRHSIRDGDDLLSVLAERIPPIRFPADIGQRLCGLCQEFRQLGCEFLPAQALRECATLFRQNSVVAALLALDHPPLWDSVQIDYIIPLGLLPIVDLEVEDTHCYVSQGLVSHNCGKSRGIGGYETALHATGNYPEWWRGFRIPEAWGAPEIWISGETSEWLRDNAWKELLGSPGSQGTGLIPADSIYHVDRASSPAGAINRVWVKHKSGGKAIIGAKSWSQGRDSYSGSKRPFIWLDEEHPADIVQECKMRTMSTRPGDPSGRILCTLTPLDGITEFIQPLVNEPDTPDRRVWHIGWDDVPHLSEEAKRVMLAGMPDNQRESRTRGIPDVGEGQVYPFPESSWLEDAPNIPEHWYRVYGMDCGWNVTAVVWGAHDRDNDIVHIYGEHYEKHAAVPIHASAIRARGSWIPGVADAAAIANQNNGEQLIQQYRREGLSLILPDKSVWAGIQAVKTRFATGRLKIARTCSNLRKEIPLYRWQNGKIVKKDDHCLDSTRYLIFSGLDIAKTDPKIDLRWHPPKYPMTQNGLKGGGWMA